MLVIKYETNILDYLVTLSPKKYQNKPFSLIHSKTGTFFCHFAVQSNYSLSVHINLPLYLIDKSNIITCWERERVWDYNSNGMWQWWLRWPAAAAVIIDRNGANVCFVVSFTGREWWWLILLALAQPLQPTTTVNNISYMVLHQSQTHDPSLLLMRTRRVGDFLEIVVMDEMVEGFSDCQWLVMHSGGLLLLWRGRW